ncbi:NlpC/P60 family protein [Marinactinospora thermotolerans]|uniref:Cell wall-associated hydrolase, NlpC family n=1 Tax=Marinactinospora thermotolerans DSM 45154 TaxID=1122192 RepID=A0A1T4MEY9_9ACTN|nr:NlpC/P60 family protein [Marinactinospora thermotolerans]SJZ65427.1 Cell wall-associated hydrolase, NlpC family [Marinactinospora thermotolerans DSM 45154]
MDERHDRGSYRRHLASVGFIAAGALILTPAVAHADPTAQDVQEEIEQLERDFSALNEEYNQAKQDHDAAQKKLEEIQDDLEETDEGLAALRDDVRILASSAYSGVDYGSPAYLLGSQGPEQVLRQSADLGYLSSSQQASLERYSSEKDKLAKLEAEAQQIEQEAADKLAEAEEAKEEGEAKIAEQEELLEQLTAEEQEAATANLGSTSSGSASSSSSSSSGGGASYTGSASGNARVALDFAYAQIGKPYIWGGNGPDGYDCSGLTKAAWAQAGVSLPRTSQEQFHAGTRVSWDQLQPGDLMFFYGSSPTHVGMYAGNGKMVHASTSSKPIGEVTLNDYYRSEFVGGVRP